MMKDYPDSTSPIRLRKFGDSWEMAYEKTPWILKMLEGVLGPENFLRGIKNLLQRFKFDSVTSDDFFEGFQVLTEVSKLFILKSFKNS